MRVNCSGRGIVELDLQVVFATEEERNALAVVKHLDLSRNELRQVTNLQPFSCLATLELGHNKIQALAGLPLGLVRLSVPYNELTTLDGLATLPFLQELDVSHNRLSTLAGLPRTSPLTVLKLTHNRLSNISGIEAVQNTLQVLELDSNYLCVVDDLRPLSRMKTLQQVTIRDNPMVDNANYRTAICQMVPTLLVLDGTAVAGGVEGIPTGQSFLGAHSFSQLGGQDVKGTRPVSSPVRGAPGSSPPRRISYDTVSAAAATNVSAGGSSPSRSQGTKGGGALRPMSYDSIRARVESRRGDVVEDNKKLQTDIDELTRLLDRERAEAEKSQRKIRQLESEVREVRRMLAEELNKLNVVRQENDQLRQDAETHKARADKVARDYKYAREKAKSERQRRLEDLEKSKVSHQAVVQSLRSRLHEYAEDGRSTTDVEQSLRAEIHSLQDTIQQLEQENRDLSLTLSTQSNAYGGGGTGGGGLEASSARVLGQAPLPQPSFRQSNNEGGPIFPRPGQRPAQSQRQLQYEGDPEQENGNSVAQMLGGGSHMVDFAAQLKEWLVAELQERQGITPGQGGTAPRQDPGPRPSISPPRKMVAPAVRSFSPSLRQNIPPSSPSDSLSAKEGVTRSGSVDDVWARNESILLGSSGGMKRT